MITAVSLSPAWDVTYVVDDLVEGRTHRPESVHRHPGGKAINLARAAVALGARARVVVPLPEGTSASFAAGLAADGVELVGVPVGGELRTCVSLASRASGRMTEVYEHAPVLEPDEVDAVVDALRGLGGSGWLALSGSVHSADAVSRLLAAHPAPAGRAVDTHGAALASAVESTPELVKVNRAEAVAWAGLDAPLEDLVDALVERTAGTVIVTDSTDGVLAATATGRWLARLPDVVGGYAQGSGDSLLAGLLAAWDGGAGDTDALRLGLGAAAANALAPGAGRFDVGTARRLAAQVVLTPA